MGDAPRLPRAGIGAQLGVGRRGRGSCGRTGVELHRRAGPHPHEGGPVRPERQATAGRLPHRGPGAHQPGAQYPRRPRRRDGRRRHGLGHPLRPQRPGGRRPHGDRPARRRIHAHAVLRRPGRVPDDAYPGERAATRRRAAALVRGRSPGDDRVVVRARRRPDDGCRAEPGQLYEGSHRPARVLRAARAGPGRRHGGVDGADRSDVRLDRRVSLRRRSGDPGLDGDAGGHGDRRRGSPSRPGPTGGLRGGDQLPPVPGAGAVTGPPACADGRCRGTDR